MEEYSYAPLSLSQKLEITLILGILYKISKLINLDKDQVGTLQIFPSYISHQRESESESACTECQEEGGEPAVH